MIHGLIVFRVFHFAWAPNNLAVNIVPWFSIPITVLKGIQWFIQEKNLLVVNFVIILQSKKLTWNITWKVTTSKIYARLDSRHLNICKHCTYIIHRFQNTEGKTWQNNVKDSFLSNCRFFQLNWMMVSGLVQFA